MDAQFSRHDDYLARWGIAFSYELQIFLPKGLFRRLRVVLLCSQAATTVYGKGNIAQLVEHSTENAGVVGSIPTVATKKAPSE